MKHESQRWWRSTCSPVRSVDVLDRRAEAGRADHRAVAAGQAAIGDVVPARVLEVAVEQLADAGDVQLAAHLRRGARVRALGRRLARPVARRRASAARRARSRPRSLPDLGDEVVAAVLEHLGEREVEAAVGGRAGAHRDAEARAAGLRRSSPRRRTASRRGACRRAAGRGRGSPSRAARTSGRPGTRSAAARRGSSSSVERAVRPRGAARHSRTVRRQLELLPRVRARRRSRTAPRRRGAAAGSGRRPARRSSRPAGRRSSAARRRRSPAARRSVRRPCSRGRRERAEQRVETGALERHRHPATLPPTGHAHARAALAAQDGGGVRQRADRGEPAGRLGEPAGGLDLRPHRAGGERQRAQLVGVGVARSARACGVP